MGNAQVLPNGNVVVGWGALPYVTEFHRGGGVRFDARLPAGGMNYRAFRLPWRGSPRDQPRLVSLAVALLQPLTATTALPGLTPRRGHKTDTSETTRATPHDASRKREQPRLQEEMRPA